jgi:carbonic anhydrase
MQEASCLVLVKAQWPEGLRPTISGEPLDGQYKFYSIVFHWGPSDEEGSEHTLDNKSYAMEVQMAHIKEGFTTPLDAIVDGAKDGLAIISFLFEVRHLKVATRQSYRRW